MNNKEAHNSWTYHEIEDKYSECDSKRILSDIMNHVNDNFGIPENVQYLIALISFYKNNYSQRGGEILFEELSKSIPEFKSIYK
nr:MAG TPA: hypothetical protein [Caudoviricetes sp.]